MKYEIDAEKWTNSLGEVKWMPVVIQPGYSVGSGHYIAMFNEKRFYPTGPIPTMASFTTSDDIVWQHYGDKMFPGYNGAPDQSRLRDEMVDAYGIAARYRRRLEAEDWHRAP